jgi:hypothetical protein
MGGVFYVEKPGQKFAGVIYDAAGLHSQFMGRPSRACANLAHKLIHRIIHGLGLGPGGGRIIQIDYAQAFFSLKD